MGREHISVGFFGPYAHGVSRLGAALSSMNGSEAPTPRRELDCGHARVPVRHRWVWLSGERTEFRQWKKKEEEPVDGRWFAMDTESRHISAVRLPPYPWTTRSQLSHFAFLDALVLVVDSKALDVDDEAMLRDTLPAAAHLCARRLLVYVHNHDAEEAGILALLLGDLFREAGYASCDVELVFGDMDEASLRRVRSALDTWTLPRRAQGPLRMGVLDEHSIRGRGDVLTGKVQRGRLVPGMDVEVIGRDIRKAQVQSVHWFRHVRSEGVAGDCVGALLKFEKPGAAWVRSARRGAVVVALGSARPLRRFVATLRWGTLPSPNALFRGRIGAQMFIEGSTVDVVLLHSGKRPLPGEHFFADVELGAPLCVEQHMRFVLRSRHRHLAVGVVHQV